MLKKLSVAVAVLGAAYVGGSYYVGYKAEQQLLAMMNNAQARAGDELVWQKVDMRHGVFTSTGSMVLVLEQVRLNNTEPVQARIDYTIHHHLHWARVAHFVWSVSPDEALSKTLESFYPTAPSLTGDGMLDWSGVATSSISFPGIDNAKADNGLLHGLLSVAPLAGSITAGNNAFDLKLGVADLTLTDPGSPERMQLKDLGYEARSADVSSGSVAVTFLLGDALLVDEDGAADAMSGYRWHSDVVYQNDILSFETQKTIASVTAMGSQASQVDVQIGIDGLHRQDIEAALSLYNEVDGQWLMMNDEQLLQAQQLVLSMLERGVSVRAPAIKADIKLLGDDTAQVVGLEGFSFSAQITDPEQAVGRVKATLGALKVPEILQDFVPAVEGFEFELANTVVDERIDLTLKKSLGRLTQDQASVRDVALELQLKGLTPESLVALIEIVNDVGGDMSQVSIEQQAVVAGIIEDAATYGLMVELPVLKGTVDSGAGQPDSIALEGLSLQAKLDDVDTGAGKASFELKQLAATGPGMADIPSLKNYRIAASNQVMDGKADYQIEKSVESLDSSVLKIGPSAVAVRLTGLYAQDLQTLSAFAPLLEQGLTEEQYQELLEVLGRALSSGFEISIPKLELAVDEARVNGQAAGSLAGLGDSPLASFDLGRAAQIQAQIDVTGQSVWLDPFVQQGLAMGLLAADGNKVQGQYQFKDGQLRLNGTVIAVNEFVLAANLLVQQLLAQAQTAKN
jgi:uncharacterized protein YdgA (DUF945 family)